MVEYSPKSPKLLSLSLCHVTLSAINPTAVKLSVTPVFGFLFLCMGGCRERSCGQIDELTYPAYKLYICQRHDKSSFGSINYKTSLRDTSMFCVCNAVVHWSVTRLSCFNHHGLSLQSENHNICHSFDVRLAPACLLAANSNYDQLASQTTFG